LAPLSWEQDYQRTIGESSRAIGHISDCLHDNEELKKPDPTVAIFYKSGGLTSNGVAVPHAAGEG
jgi:hypothetical protein